MTRVNRLLADIPGVSPRPRRRLSSVEFPTWDRPATRCFRREHRKNAPRVRYILRVWARRGGGGEALELPPFEAGYGG